MLILSDSIGHQIKNMTLINKIKYRTNEKHNVLGGDTRKEF
jgi:hypothetical protein